MVISFEESAFVYSHTMFALMRGNLKSAMSATDDNNSVDDACRLNHLCHQNGNRICYAFQLGFHCRADVKYKLFALLFKFRSVFA